MGHNDHSDSTGELLRRLSEQTSELVRQEIRLARAEMTDKGRRIGVGAGMIGGAGLIGLLALGTLTAAVVLALATAMDGWLAALIVGLIYAITAGALALTGKERAKEASPPVPEQAIEEAKETKEDVTWATKRTRSVGR